MIQVTGFGFVIAPVIMQRTNGRYSFIGSLIRIEGCLVPATILILVYYLSVLHRYQAMMSGGHP
jgi:hypothetical protein